MESFSATHGRKSPKRTMPRQSWWTRRAGQGNSDEDDDQVELTAVRAREEHEGHGSGQRGEGEVEDDQCEDEMREEGERDDEFAAGD